MASNSTETRFIHLVNDFNFLAEKKNNCFSISAVKDKSGTVHTDYSHIMPATGSPDPKNLNLDCAVTFNGGQLDNVFMAGGQYVENNETKVGWGHAIEDKDIRHFAGELSEMGLLDSIEEQIVLAVEKYHLGENED